MAELGLMAASEYVCQCSKLWSLLNSGSLVETEDVAQLKQVFGSLLHDFDVVTLHQKIGNLAPFCYCLVVRMGITVLKSKYCMVSKSVTPPSFPLFTQVNLSSLSKTQAFE